MARPGDLRWVGTDEVSDHRTELLACVLLQEVTGPPDDRVLEARRAGHSLLQDRRHCAGDRVAVAERHQEWLVPGGQLTPGGPVGLRRWIIRGRRHQARHG